MVRRQLTPHNDGNGAWIMYIRYLIEMHELHIDMHDFILSRNPLFCITQSILDRECFAVRMLNTVIIPKGSVFEIYY